MSESKVSYGQGVLPIPGFPNGRVTAKLGKLKEVRALTAAVARDDGRLARSDETYGSTEETKKLRNRRVSAAIVLADDACRTLCDFKDICPHWTETERYGSERIDDGAKALAWELWLADNNKRARFDTAVMQVETGKVDDMLCDDLLKGVAEYHRRKRQPGSQ